ncbi:(2Fe-2S)-binding protein [Roseomonas gilardii]|nr:(2Fe-2S)-binding protein [Roseomonas gilardii]
MHRIDGDAIAAASSHGRDIRMYVCLCNGITDTQVKDAIASGASRCCEIYSKCGCKAQCGTCTRMILAMMRDQPEQVQARAAR